MLNIAVKTIPHDMQRYNTVGDFKTDEKGATRILVSEMSNEKREFLIAVHEFITVQLCRIAGVTDAEIDTFDIAFTEVRDSNDSSEPGDDPNAPYYVQHQVATKVEKLMANAMGVDWNDYEREIAKLMEAYPNG